jgi:hypothetical protein
MAAYVMKRQQALAKSRGFLFNVTTPSAKIPICYFLEPSMTDNSVDASTLI